MRAARVAYVAVASRLITLLLSALFDRLVADYDTSSRLRILDCNGRTSASGKWLVIARVIFGLRSVFESRSLFEQAAHNFLGSLYGIQCSLFTLHAVDISMNNSMPSIQCCQVSRLPCFSFADHPTAMSTLCRKDDNAIAGILNMGRKTGVYHAQAGNTTT